jgi:hypothetical protein
MKVTRKQLRRLIQEVAIELSDSEISAAKQKLKDEGGAAGPEMIAKAVKDAEEGDAEVSDEDVLDALMGTNEEIVLHADGDIIDTGGITAEAINQIVRETLEEKKKRKKSKKKKKKSKKRHHLYPYVYGTHYDGLDHVAYGDYGVDGGSFDGAGDGGGGE